MPSIDELRNMYAEVLENQGVHALTVWTEPNHSDPTDEEAYLARGMNDSDDLFENIERAIDAI